MDISRIDFNLLKVLDALLSETSVSGAAQRLGLSQPATSAALSRLRRVTGDLLLVRRGNLMVPTARAEELRPRVARLVDEIAQTLQQPVAFDPMTSHRRFRVIANEYATLVLMAPLALRLRETAPNVTLEVLPFDPRFEERLAAQDCDLVVGHRDFLGPARRTEALFTETWVSIARADHPRLGAKVTLDAFLAESHAMVTSTGRAEGNVDRALARIGRERTVALTLPHFLVAPEVIARSDLVMTLPHCVASTFAETWPLRLFPPPLDLAGFEVALVRHPRSVGDPPVDWLRREIDAVCARLSATCTDAGRSFVKPIS
ncbi:LysR family transcriptional regulator [Rhizobiaceae bacterium BDR2-2]|uniref:LysR family transcriptional regulator n=1 Tax=Ectorhizobium quercum TaxID=2965071 RepID=A0AAE3SU63_9HYPH|nr:LysR family transcriptional regulator [Ectorhizobium quercum]MCX8995709.1 LysR family transcriptional regulator [Ectorhizobium quercum]